MLVKPLEAASATRRDAAERLPSDNSHDEHLAVETHALSKRYGDQLAVDRLALRVRRGEVYGFLGPNGAGKTTTLRMLLGLVRPTSGSASVLGAEPGAAQALARTGALIEGPGFYPYLSGRDNLRVLAGHAGVPAERVETALAEVDLSGRAGDRFSSYSLGMKQRLGVAAALLKEPDLLILDEPTNGLDPAGTVEMRALIRGLGQDGRTVLLSSHLIGEVEQICDRIGVIRRGSLVAEGTVVELRGRDRLRLRAEPLDIARRVILALPGIDDVERLSDSVRIGAGLDAAPAITRALVEAGVAVSELYHEQTSLEEIFLELTQGQEQEQEGMEIA